MKPVKPTAAYAVVLHNGKVKVDTVCSDRESSEYFMINEDKQRGATIRRVKVVAYR